jgi:TorA maturation chaperone TorD
MGKPRLSEKNFSENQKLAEARGNIYNLLSQIFLFEPSKEFLKGINETKFLYYLSNVSNVYLKAREILEDYLKSLKGDKEYISLRQEYMNLFLVPGRQYVRPYESVYKDKQFGSKKASGLMMGESTTAVKKFYKQSGAKISDGQKNLPDHFGLELEFMSFLCKKEAEEWKNNNESLANNYFFKQKSFLENHLIQWIYDFCSELASLAKLDFYKGVAMITREFVRQDFELVETMIKKLKKKQ